jgi:TonB family protein
VTLSWAIYALLVSAALGWAAAATESGLRLYDRQARFVWAAAMLGSILVPALTLAAPGPLSLIGSGGASGGSPPWAVPAVPAIMGTVQGAAESGGSLFRWVEGVFYAGWIAGSGWLLFRLLASVRSVHRRRADWSRLPTPGGAVYRDEELGPAAVGFLSPEVVLSGWVLELDEDERRMVILHEREHARVMDPAVIACGWALLVLVPWNLLLWWQFRRLRQAVELDCDLRVVRRTRDRRAYGRVLLEAARNSREGAVPVVAGGQSFVGDRIRSLVDGTPPFRPLRAVSAFTAIVCAAVLAATLPSPRAASAWSKQAVISRLVEGPRQVSREAVTVANRAEVVRAIGELHPDELRGRGIGGTVNVLVHIRPDGTVDEAIVQRTTGHRSLDRAAREAARRIEFEPLPGAAGDSGAWIVQPLRFPTE